MRIRDYVTALLFLCLIGGVALYVNRAEWVGLDGFSVVDGDSLARGNQRYRLAGIDAPELDQRCLLNGRGLPCGQQAKDHLATLIRGVKLECIENGEDRYGRLLVVCREQGNPVASAFRSADLDVNIAGFEPTVNARMVLDGWAVAYGDYLGLELLARTANRGIWATDFEHPDEWRRANGI